MKVAVLAAGTTLATAGCGQSREAELEQQLAEAKAQAANQTSAREAAEATERKARETALARFYSGGDSTSTETETPQPEADAAQPQPANAPVPTGGFSPPTPVPGGTAPTGPINNGPFRVGERTEPVG